MLLIDFRRRRPFHTLLNPAPALCISDVGELYADRSRIDAPGFTQKFAVNLQFWMRRWLQKSEWFKIGCQVSPAPECIEDTFALLIDSCFRHFNRSSFCAGISSSGHNCTTSIKDVANWVLDSNWLCRAGLRRWFDRRSC